MPITAVTWHQHVVQSLERIRDGDVKLMTPSHGPIFRNELTYSIRQLKDYSLTFKWLTSERWQNIGH